MTALGANADLTTALGANAKALHQTAAVLTLLHDMLKCLECRKEILIVLASIHVLINCTWDFVQWMDQKQWQLLICWKVNRTCYN